MINRKVVSGSVSLLALGWIPLVWAQDVPSAAPEPAQTRSAIQQGRPADDGDIVVTARRVEENIQDVPIAITAMSGAALQREGVRNVTDLTSSIPNLNVTGANVGAGATVFTIRGTNQSNILLTIDSAVGLYFDGVSVPRPYGTAAALVDIARVEVLRGPQGTLYGRNTTGGAVSFVTNDPTDSLNGSIQATGGNYDTWGLTGIVNIPITDDVAARFVALHSEHDGYGKSLTTGQRLAKDNSTYLRGTIKAESGAFKMNLKGDYTKMSGATTITRISGITAPTAASPGGGGLSAAEAALELGLAPNYAALLGLRSTDVNRYNAIMIAGANALLADTNAGDFQNTNGNVESISRYKGGSVNLTMEYEIDDNISVKSISGWRGFNSIFLQDTDGTRFQLNEAYSPTSDDFYSQELQLLGGGPLFNYVFGGFYSYEKGHAEEVSNSLARIQGGRLSVTDGDVISKSVAAFGQANIKLTDRLGLTVGGRVTKETKKLISRNYIVSPTGIQSCNMAAAFLDDGVTCVRTASNSYSKPTWLVSLNYDFSPDILGYGKISRGFHGGGQNLRASGAAPEIYAPFAPEVVTEYEIGLKSELFDRRLRLNLAIFQDDFSGLQRSINILLGGGATGTVVTNAAGARLRGFEGEATLKVAGGFSLNGSLGYVDPKYTKFVDFTGDRTNEPWPAAHWNYALTARYNSVTNYGRIDGSLGWQWQSKSYISGGTNAVNLDQTEIPAYGLLNARLATTINSLGLEVAVYGRNILDKNYFSNGINFEALGLNQRSPGLPRTFGIQLTKTFGAGS